MTTYVLCHGGWTGGWGYGRVARIIREAGNEVFVPTYTGIGECAHLLTPEVNLDAHILDVLALIKCERLDDFVLVGYSYGGMVITGVADKEHEKISKIVYLDAFLPQNGQSLDDLLPTAQQAHLLTLVKEMGDGWLVPRPDGSIADTLSDEDRDWIESLSSPQPLVTFTQKIQLVGN